MKSRFDFDRVEMTDKILKEFHKGEKFLPAYAGQRIRFVNGISDPLTPQQIQWALSFQDGMQFKAYKGTPKLESPTAIGEAILPPPPLDILDEIGNGGLEDDSQGTGEGLEDEDGTGEGLEEVIEKYPGEKSGIENITDYSAKDAVVTASEEKNPEALDFYLRQEESLGGKARKTVLQAIQERKAELAG